MKAVFLDRDGTINAGIPVYERIDSIDKLKLLPDVIDGLKKLAKLDYGVFLVTNQAGIAEGLISMNDFENINNELLRMIAPSGIKILKTYVCPHGENSTCNCRKPKPGLLLEAANDYNIDLANSWVVGDRPTDVEAGVNAGTRVILVQTGAKKAESDKATYTADNLLDAIKYISNHQ